MDVTVERFLDRSEPDRDGRYEYSYEGTDTTFTFHDGRSLRARRYNDEPETASLHFDNAGPHEFDAETTFAVDWLHNDGVTKVQVLGGPSGYRDIWQ